MKLKENKVAEYLDKIEDNTIKELTQLWVNEVDLSRKAELKNRIMQYISQHERDSFFARFLLHDFDSWQDVLNEEESKQYHTANFYKETLMKVLGQHNVGIEPMKAIIEVKDRLSDQMLPGDFKISKSKRIRYDTMIRSLYIILKRNDIIMSFTRKGITYWILKRYRMNLVK
jgi:hypothetical protein